MKEDLSLCSDNLILYRKNPRPIKILSELINNFSKVAGHKINIQKSESFPYRNNEIPEKEGTNSLTKALAAIKHLGINVTKEVKSWNCKTLMKKLKMTQVNGTDMLIIQKN